VARKEAEGDTPVLHIYIEPRTAVSDVESNVEASIHERLKQLSKDYNDLAGVFGCKPLRVTKLRTGVFNNYVMLKRTNGTDPALLKPPHMNPSDGVMQALLAGTLPVTGLSSNQDLITQV
jgi:hypothetical protein